MYINDPPRICESPVYGLFEDDVIPEFEKHIETRPISLPHVKEWIDHYKKSSDKEAATFIYRHITHIPFSVFEENLLKAAYPIIDMIPNSVFLIEPEKSQLWVARIVTSSFAKSPYAYLRMGPDSANLLETTLESLPEEFDYTKLENIVVIDDGAFSGNQMANNISQTAKHLNKIGIKSPIFHIVVPYITEIALEKLNNLKEKGVDIKQYHNKIPMQSVMDIVSRDKKGAQLQNRIFELLWEESDQTTRIKQAISTTMTYFDHNVPNSMSFPRHLVDLGIVPTITPLYKSNYISHRSTPVTEIERSSSTSSLPRFTPSPTNEYNKFNLKTISNSPQKRG